jgi:hypothetical protein
MAIGLTVLSFSVVTGQTVATTFAPEYHWPCHRGELAYFRMGCELEANRNISLRLVADRSTAQSVSTTCRGAGGVKAV